MAIRITEHVEICMYAYICMHVNHMKYHTCIHMRYVCMYVCM